MLLDVLSLWVALVLVHVALWGAGYIVVIQKRK
jgi:hypothetical protein